MSEFSLVDHTFPFLTEECQYIKFHNFHSVTSGFRYQWKPWAAYFGFVGFQKIVFDDKTR